MNDTTPPLHPMEREQLRAESTLVVTVKSSSEYHDDVTDRIEALERERRRGIHRVAPFERLDPVGDVVMVLTGRLHSHDEG